MAARTARLALRLAVVPMVAGLLTTGGADTAAAAPEPAGTPADSDGTIDVMVLGDSYSAGNGATDDAGAEQIYGPDGCYRSRVNWGEKYAAALRRSGHQVRLVNHACSGGVSADFTQPREMDTASRSTPTPSGVTTTAQADTYLANTDPCNTRQFPDEEFWTYRATSVTPVVLNYECTRHLRPQLDFVNPQVDLLLYTMGGNDAGFSSIVQNCFVPVLRTASGCQSKIEAARALLPQIRERLLAAVAAMRTRGLRDDARLVQLGYPNLQVDNNFTLVDGTGTYDAGNQVRALVAEGNAAIAAVIPVVNAGHDGQAAFLDGVPAKFAGHEPDATTPIGNPGRWINQIGDGSGVGVWYHPNRFGQTAYAELLDARGTFGAPTGPPAAVTAKLKARVRQVPARPGNRIRLRVKVTLSDGTGPRGKLVIRGLPGGRKLTTKKLRMKDHGTLRFSVSIGDRELRRVRLVYRDRVAPVVKVTQPIH